MRITSIVENTSTGGWDVEHGLSLYVQLEDGRNVLFDMGQGALFAANAARAGLPIDEVDVAVISHGHYDHGGGLRTFLTLNKRAQVWVHAEAFRPHYSLHEEGLRYIGLERELEVHDRLAVSHGATVVDEGLLLFAEVQGCRFRPQGNRLLFGPSAEVNDDFCHEQSLLIREGERCVLLAGCAHCGIVNIMDRAIALTGQTPTHVLAGMHLVNSGMDDAQEEAFAASLAATLTRYPSTQFITMHCTGASGFARLHAHMGSRCTYLSCGESVVL